MTKWAKNLLIKTNASNIKKEKAKIPKMSYCQNQRRKGDKCEIKRKKYITLYNHKMKLKQYLVGQIIILTLLLATTHSAILPVPSPYITPSQMQSILATIDSYFFSPAPIFKMEIRKFLRAAFHDCSGGCDGSLNLKNTDNRGLEIFLKVLNDAFTRATNSTKNPNNFFLFNKLSRADFWILSEERALAWGIKNGNSRVSISGPVYKYGRTTTNPIDLDNFEGKLPGGKDAWQTMLNSVISSIPTINETDIVAFLGFHGAGTATFSNSGYRGPWGAAQDKNVVNNNFYKTLLGYNVAPKATFNQTLASNGPSLPPSPLDGSYTSPPPPQNLIQWVRNGNPPNINVGVPKMMLPVDMQIYLSFTPNATGGQDQGAYCPQSFNSTLYNCTQLNTPNYKYLPLASNARIAKNFADDLNAYIAYVVPAFLRLVGYTNPMIKLTEYSPGWVCVNGKAQCYGDILFSGCSSPPIAC